MMKMRTTLAALAVSILMAPQAEARSIGEIFGECGIGAAIFNDNTTAAAISNIIWDLGTTATSSDLSSKENCEGKSAKVAMFIGSSYDNLETEIATGNGKYIETLAKLSNKSVSEIRSKFSTIVGSESYSKMTKMEKADKLYTIVAL